MSPSGPVWEAIARQACHVADRRAQALFSQYGSTSYRQGFDDPRHQAGPVAVWKLGEDWRVHTDDLFGVTDASPDSTLRSRLTHEYYLQDQAEVLPLK